MDRTEIEKTITEAIGAHGAWKMKLRVAVNSGVLPKPAAAIARDDDCPLGKWLSRVKSEPEMRNSAAFDAVCRCHAEFHAMAGKIARQIEQGDRAGAIALLDDHMFHQSSRALAYAMTRWRREL